jgi:hypothetical protein
MPFPCPSPASLIHACRAATLLFSENATSFVKVRVVDGNIRTASLLLVTTFVDLRVIAGRSRKQAGRPHAVSGRQLLIHTYHAVPMPLSCRAVPWSWEAAFRTTRSWHCRGTAWGRHGNGMACVNQTWLRYVNQMGKIQSKLLAERHGRGTALYVWIRH